MAAYQVTGAELFRTYYLSLLAETFGTAGQIEEGLTVLVEALKAVGKTEERFYEAERYRLKGELMLKKSEVRSPESEVSKSQSLDPKSQIEVEACFLKAIDIAQKQQAKSWELRVTTSLARLWQHQGKKADAHKLLSDIYNWFTEGFDTKDRQEAKVLIEELAEKPKE